ncbi:helix-turn-helix domain-containing protein [Chryseobacterium sp. T1]
MSHRSSYFPILGIQDFKDDRSLEMPLLFNELYGERSIDDPHKHDFFIINIFEKAKGNHTIDFVDYEVKNHQIHLVFPDQVHQWDIEAGTVGYQLMIGRDWFESLIPALRFSQLLYQNHPVIDLSDASFSFLVYEFKTIQKLLNSDSIFWEMVKKRSEMIGLLISEAVESIFKNDERYHSNPIFSKFSNLIDEYFKEERSVSFYAEKLNISPNYLNIICKKSINSSASSLIQDRILLEAKRLLKVSRKSVKDIVFELGFYDQASFSKFFKSQTGMTPSQFKE